MAEAVVDVLEVVQVVHDERGLFAVAGAFGQRALGADGEVVAVADAGQRVGLGHLLQRQLHALDLECPVADGGYQHDQQHHDQPVVLRRLLIHLALELQHLVLLVQQVDLLVLLNDLLTHQLVGQFACLHLVQVGLVGLGVFLVLLKRCCRIALQIGDLVKHPVRHHQRQRTRDGTTLSDCGSRMLFGGLDIAHFQAILGQHGEILRNEARVYRSFHIGQVLFQQRDSACRLALRMPLAREERP